MSSNNGFSIVSRSVVPPGRRRHHEYGAIKQAILRLTKDQAIAIPVPPDCATETYRKRLVATMYRWPIPRVAMRTSKDRKTIFVMLRDDESQEPREGLTPQSAP